jgi:Protein of unknown function (DUF3592)
MDVEILVKFFLIGVAVFGGIVLLATAVKLREVWRCRTWLTTSGKVIVSKVESRRRGGVRKGTDEDTMGNYPQVVYEYTVDDHKYKGKRISIGEQMPDFQVEETLEKYPKGAAVDVYYNPDLPGQSVLERDLPPNFTKVLAGLCVFLLACAIILPIGMREFTARIATYIDRPENAVLVAVLLGMVIFIVLYTFALQRRFQQVTGWPSTAGKVVSSFVEASLDLTPTGDDGHSTYKTSVLYQAKVIYSYGVRGQTYRGDRLALGSTSGGSMAKWLVSWFKRNESAEKQPDFVDTTHDKRGNPNSVPIWVTRKVLSYPKGMAIKVFYNPENPAEAVVEKRISGFLLLYIVAAALLLLALRLAGVVGH